MELEDQIDVVLTLGAEVMFERGRTSDPYVCSIKLGSIHGTGDGPTLTSALSSAIQDWRLAADAKLGTEHPE